MQWKPDLKLRHMDGIRRVPQKLQQITDWSSYNYRSLSAINLSYTISQLYTQWSADTKTVVDHWFIQFLSYTKTAADHWFMQLSIQQSINLRKRQCIYTNIIHVGQLGRGTWSLMSSKSGTWMTLCACDKLLAWSSYNGRITKYHMHNITRKNISYAQYKSERKGWCIYEGTLLLTSSYALTMNS